MYADELPEVDVDYIQLNYLKIPKVDNYKQDQEFTLYIIILYT